MTHDVPDYAIVGGVPAKVLRYRKTEENYQLIRKYLKENGLSKTTDIAQAIGLSPARTRAILKEMSGLEYEGTTNNRRYRLADDN